MESQNTEWKASWRDDYLRWIEAWGQGIQRIFDACKAGGIPLPLLGHKGVDLWTEFSFTKQYLAAVNDTKAKSGAEPRLDEKLGETRAAILKHMVEFPKTTVTELGERLSISRNGIDKNIQILKGTGYIRRIGPAKGGHWEVPLNPPSESE